MNKLGFGLIICSAVWGADATGHWNGTIQIPEHEFKISVDLARNAQGTWIGSMTVLKTNTVDVPLGSIVVDGDAVRFVAHLPERASFEGRLSADGATVSGKAVNEQGDAPFVMARSGEANVKVPPPSTAVPSSFQGDWEASVKGKRVGLRLSASDAVLIAEHEIPVTTVRIEEMQIALELRSVSGTYRGILANDEIVGEWSEGSTHLPLAFKRSSSSK